MDPSAFDTLTRAIAQTGTRRGLVRLVASLPLVGVLAAVGEEQSAAERPIDRLHRRTSQRNHKRRNNKNHHHKNHNNDNANNGGGGGPSPGPCQGCPGRCCTGSSGRAWCCAQNDSCCGDGVAPALCCIANQRCCTGALGAQCCDPNETCCNGQCCNPRQTCDSEFGCIDND